MVTGAVEGAKEGGRVVDEAVAVGPVVAGAPTLSGVELVAGAEGVLVDDAELAPRRLLCVVR